MTIASVKIARRRGYPPRVSEFTKRFWTALSEGSLETTSCGSCGEITFPPKPICPHCWHSEVQWVQLPTTGRLYSWTRIHAGPAVFEPELPYAVGIIDLDIAVRMAVRLHEPKHRNWVCGEQVRLVRLDYLDGPLLGAAAI